MDAKRYGKNIYKFIKKESVTQKFLPQVKFSSKDIDSQTCRNSVNAEHVLINILEDKFLLSKVNQVKKSGLETP